MIPHTEEALRLIAASLVMSSQVNGGPMYSRFDTGLLATLLGVLASEYNRGVQTRIDDIHEMQHLFEAAVAWVGDDALLERLRENVALATRGLAIEELNGAHGTSTALLIDLHAYAEEGMASGSRDAASCNDDIWEYLGRHTERHAVDSV